MRGGHACSPRAKWRDPVPLSNASCSTFSPRSAARVNMPPDSKELSSLKDKSLSFHRLHATDLDRMKGIYLSAEELRGFDKYKVQLDQLIVSVARSIIDRSSEYYSWCTAFSGLFHFLLVQIRRYIALVKLLNTSFLEFCCGGEDSGKRGRLRFLRLHWVSSDLDLLLPRFFAR